MEEQSLLEFLCDTSKKPCEQELMMRVRKENRHKVHKRYANALAKMEGERDNGMGTF